MLIDRGLRARLWCVSGCRRKSGYGGYGPFKGTLRGARVIVLRRGQSTSYSETWIRQEDGEQRVGQWLHCSTSQVLLSTPLAFWLLAAVSGSLPPTCQLTHCPTPLPAGSRVDQPATPAAAKQDSLQHTCISDGGVLGWVGWSTRAARLTTWGTMSGLVAVAVVAGMVVVWGAQRRAAAAAAAAKLQRASSAAAPLLGAKGGHRTDRQQAAASVLSVERELSLSVSRSLSSAASSVGGQSDLEEGMDESEEQGSPHGK